MINNQLINTKQVQEKLGGNCIFFGYFRQVSQKK